MANRVLDIRSEERGEGGEGNLQFSWSVSLAEVRKLVIALRSFLQRWHTDDNNDKQDPVDEVSE